MDNNRNYQVDQLDEPVKLRYPLEDWIEQLLRKYPSELSSIRPDKETQRSEKLQRMRAGLRERAKQQLF